MITRHLTTLLGAASLGAAAASYPAQVEASLVFPRNETYAPGPVFPIVFAVRNLPAAVAASSDMTIEYQLLALDQLEVDYLASASVRLERVYSQDRNDNSDSDSDSDSDSNDDKDQDQDKEDQSPHYIVRATARLDAAAGVAGRYGLKWFVRHVNCSVVTTAWRDGVRDDLEYGSVHTGHITAFTIADPADTPTDTGTGTGNDNNNGNETARDPWDVVGGQDETCRGWDSSAVEISGTLPRGDSDGVCAVVPEPTVRADPCAARLDAAAAADVSAQLTRWACATPSPVMTEGCPPPATETSRGSRAAPGGALGMLGLVGALSLAWTLAGGVLFLAL